MQNSESLTGEIAGGVKEIPCDKILPMVPQITGQLNHPLCCIKNLVIELLQRVGTVHFQDVFFPLNLAVRDGSQVANEILESLKQIHGRLSGDLELFCDGMVRASGTWFESWKTTLEVASHGDHRHGQLLSARFNEFRSPKCEMDFYFTRRFSSVIRECSSLFAQHTPESFRMMWGRFKGFYEQLKEKVNQLSSVLLFKVAEDLARRRSFLMTIPGSNELLEHIEPVLEILGTQQHPRCTYFVSSAGSRVKFLLKGNEDLRLDERVMQFFALVNTLFRPSKSHLGFAITCYPILPLTKEAGLIKWLTGAATMHQMVVDDRALRGVPVGQESEVCRDFMKCEFSLLNSLQKMEMFGIVSKKCLALELFEYMWLKSPNAATWLQRIDRFTRSTALVSMMGYIIGLGDRHPSNLMIQNETGNLIHIDFGESFDSATVRHVNPEKVPFRLTRMIVNALEGGVTDGLCQMMCVRVMQLLRKHWVTLGTQFSIFLHEGLEMCAR
jgi:hypothetical protein